MIASEDLDPVMPEIIRYFLVDKIYSCTISMNP